MHDTVGFKRCFFSLSLGSDAPRGALEGWNCCFARVFAPSRSLAERSLDVMEHGAAVSIAFARMVPSKRSSGCGFVQELDVK